MPPSAQLAQRMADEQKIAKTNSVLFQGSQTEPRRQGALATAVREAKTPPLEIGTPGVALAHDNPMMAAGETLDRSPTPSVKGTNGSDDHRSGLPAAMGNYTCQLLGKLRPAMRLLSTIVADLIE
jgi:hypothetical protein